jgi:hypothetical protein
MRKKNLMKFNEKTMAAYMATIEHSSRCEFCHSSTGNLLNCPVNENLAVALNDAITEQESLQTVTD